MSCAYHIPGSCGSVVSAACCNAALAVALSNTQSSPGRASTQPPPSFCDCVEGTLHYDIHDAPLTLQPQPFVEAAPHLDCIFAEPEALEVPRTRSQPPTLRPSVAKHSIALLDANVQRDRTKRLAVPFRAYQTSEHRNPHPNFAADDTFFPAPDGAAAPLHTLEDAYEPRIRTL